MECKYCEKSDLRLVPQLIPTGRDTFIRYTLQVRSECRNCGRFNKFVEQDDDLIEATNEVIRGAIDALEEIKDRKKITLAKFERDKNSTLRTEYSAKLAAYDEVIGLLDKI